MSKALVLIIILLICFGAYKYSEQQKKLKYVLAVVSQLEQKMQNQVLPNLELLKLQIEIQNQGNAAIKSKVADLPGNDAYQQMQKMMLNLTEVIGGTKD